MKTILQEAQEIIKGERAESYGHPYHDFKCTADMITAYLEHKGILAQGKRINAADVPAMMICVKLSREANKHKRDNLVDIAGYAGTLEKVIDKENEIWENMKELVIPSMRIFKTEEEAKKRTDKLFPKCPHCGVTMSNCDNVYLCENSLCKTNKEN